MVSSVDFTESCVRFLDFDSPVGSGSSSWKVSFKLDVALISRAMTASAKTPHV